MTLPVSDMTKVTRLWENHDKTKEYLYLRTDNLIYLETFMSETLLRGGPLVLNKVHDFFMLSRLPKLPGPFE